MVNYKMILAYDGTNYFGYQKQNHQPSIQGEVERVLKLMLNVNEITNFASGRTDRGVHAKGQVINFFVEESLDLRKFLKSFNSLVNPDIRASSIEEVPKEFHARYSAISKEYLYIINNKTYNPTQRHYELFIEKKIDISLIREAINLLKGEHDFKAFTVTDCINPSIKNLSDIVLVEEEERYYFYFRGNGFLRYMVRTIMGLLIEIGTHKKSLDCIEKAFETKNRSLLGKMAPSQGLYLTRVEYPQNL